jgi:molecular chaperone IbpA
LQIKPQLAIIEVMKTQLAYYTSPLGVGFDLLSSNRESDNYPKHNIIRSGENSYVIELAVAGFTSEDLNVESINNELTITGKIKKEELPESGFPDYLHRGIASRSFKRVFTLAEYVEVKEAKHENGILSISLERRVPEEKKPKIIPIV